jgi:hypothetical protein
VDDHCKRSDKVTETECAAIAGRIWFDKGCRPRDEVACVQDKTKAFVKGSCLDRPTLTLTGATTQSILAGASFAPVAFAVSVGSKVELRPLLCTGYFTTKNGQVVVADATALAAGDVSHCAVALVAISRDTESLPQVMTINFVPGFLSICESATAATATQRQTIDLIEIALKDTNCKSAAAKLFAATDLTLAGKGIADLTPLAGLTGLTSLDLSGNQIVDLAPLADLTGLKSLDLSKNIDLANVSALAALKGLVALNLTDTALQRTPGIKTDANCPVANVGDKLREFCTAR